MILLNSKNGLEAKKEVKKNTAEEIKLFKFNPNTITKDSMMLLGLSSKQSYNIINYRSKVGKFNSEKDFRKIYSISDSLANVLETFFIFYKS